MSDLESRQLRYFVAVAEELHFGRAAERLGMAQPPLSRAIRDLERHLGVQLLRRTTREVALTPAGEVLLRDARTALDAIAAAARRAQNAGQPTPALRVALKADYDAGLLPRFLSVYREDPAALAVEVLLGGRGEQVPALRDGRADVALLPRPFDERGLDVEVLLVEPRLLAIAADDPLAAHPTLRLDDLAGRFLPGGGPADRPETATPHDPRHKSYDLAQLFNLVELGTVVWFLPESVARCHPRPGVAYRTVEGLGPSTLCVAWPRDSRDHAVAAFVRAATAVALDAAPVPAQARS
ncbi:LysR family transcriptional regulator [Dactylosporangium sp. AC04546]|uniref:LysR family transcriptional regulator n=1 Tax=Dactylosporangium sp. AC04546 TaxID=2862460 RepID=UPI001EDCCACC|nr:LysR family transcriptional regulator [Dactylosporangium sp. AC04546]WVK79735.1 LysR family transcriptional regulator [Dactylosporangium sp. AC04546]